MAARFFVVGGVDTNWSTIGNWSLTSGGAGGQAVPLATDDVTLDGNSGSACVLNTSARVAKTLTINGYTGSLTFNQQLSVSGSITFTTTGFTFAGATTNKLRMIAAGTWTTNAKTIPQDVEIGGTTTFTCTLAQAVTTSGDLALTNTTSTIFSGAFLLTAATCTISGTQTVTIANDLQITGLTTIADQCSIAGAGKNWKTGGLTMSGILANIANIVTILFNGTGTWSGTSRIENPVTINTAGTLTISGTVAFGVAGGTTLTYTAGTVVTTGSTLNLAVAAQTITTAGMTWDTISLASGSLTVSSALNCATFTITTVTTLTLNALLTVTGTLTLPNAAVTFAGTAGWTVGTLTTSTPGATRITTFQAGNTYTILTAFTTVHSNAQTVRFTWVSSTPGTAARLVLTPIATQDVGFVDPTDIDASAGQQIFTYHGVVTTSPNWVSQFPVMRRRVVQRAGRHGINVYRRVAA